MKFWTRKPAKLPQTESQVDEQELARWREGEASEPIQPGSDVDAYYFAALASLEYDLSCSCRAACCLAHKDAA